MTAKNNKQQFDNSESTLPIRRESRGSTEEKICGG